MSKLEFTEGKNKMTITKDDKGNLISVKDQNGKDIEPLDISVLKLGDEKAKKRGQITNISDDTVIETHSSPGCKWYFFNGNWYRICS